jgi:hypothetical protein
MAHHANFWKGKLKVWYIYRYSRYLSGKRISPSHRLRNIHFDKEKTIYHANKNVSKVLRMSYLLSFSDKRRWLIHCSTSRPLRDISNLLGEKQQKKKKKRQLVKKSPKLWWGNYNSNSDK